MNERKVLREGQYISYSLPVIPAAMLISPMAIIQGVYAKHYGIALSALGVIILISRLIDAIADPLAGYYSDLWVERKGSRLSVILAGCLLVTCCAYFLYNPTSDANNLEVGIWFVLFYVSYTVFEMPHVSWPKDFSLSNSETLKVYSYRVLAGYLGLILFYCVPLLPLFDSSEITPETLKVNFMVAAVLFLIFAFQIIRSFGNNSASISVGKRNRYTLLDILKNVTRNKPFVLFLVGFIFYGMAVGFWYGAIFIYVDAYLLMGDQFASVFLFAFIIGCLTTPIWYRVAVLLGKKTTWSIALLVLILSFIYTGWLNPDNVAYAHLLALKSMQTSGFVGIGVVVPSMISDIIDYSHWKFKDKHPGVYFSVQVFLEKANGTIGVSLGLLILDFYGFEINSDNHSIASVDAMKMVIAYLPILLSIASLVCIYLYPINERRHQAIVKSIEARIYRKS